MKITDKIHLLKIDFEIPVTPEKKLQRFVNVILIFGSRITLIDTGVSGSEELISDYISQNGRDFSEIDTVILSHSHPDHIGSAARIRELTGCRILAHMGEREWIENIDLQNRERPVPGFFSLVDRPVKVDEFITDGQEIAVEPGLTLKFIHSPGHSKGSLNVLFREEGILFTADSIPLKNDIPNYDDYSELIKSLAQIRKSSDYKILLTSWTPPLLSRDEIASILAEGEEYIKQVDLAVRASYTSSESSGLDSCRAAIHKLGLPPFLATPLVDRAFRSHFK